MTEKQIELNDDCVINVTLPNHQWNVVVDWLAHSPYQEAKTTLDSLNTQIQKRTETDQQATSFTGELPIKTFNMLIFALGQAPYYIVAEIIQSIYTQGQQEIARLRDQANTMKAPVEKSENSPDNSTQEQTSSKTTRKRRTKKSA